MVELNVIEQCINVYKTGVVQRKRLKQRRDNASGRTEDLMPRIHGMVFDPATGFLRKLNIDYSARVGSLEHIYRLY